MDNLTVMVSWPARKWVAAVLGAVGFALVAGVPTAVVPTAFFGRTIAAQWWSYPVLAVTAALGGLILATYVRTSDTSGAGRIAGGGILSAFAIGCPVCNKAVVVLLGFSGALTVWQPIQPIIGLASVGLLGWSLWLRLKGERQCPVPAGRTS